VVRGGAPPRRAPRQQLRAAPARGQLLLDPGRPRGDRGLAARVPLPQAELRNNTEEPIRLSRGAALRRAHITTRNVTRARQILERALARLEARGFVVRHTPISTRADETFLVYLSPAVPGASPPPPAGEAVGSARARRDIPGRRGRPRGRGHEEAGPSLWSEEKPAGETVSVAGESDGRESDGRDADSPYDQVTGPGPGPGREETTTADASPHASTDTDASSEQEADTGGVHEGSSTYAATITIGGVPRSARITWDFVRERIRTRRPGQMVNELASQARARGRVDEFPDGDVQVLLAIQVPPWALHIAEGRLLLEVEEALLQVLPGQPIGIAIEAAPKRSDDA
jgi:hypothetical protein